MRTRVRAAASARVAGAIPAIQLATLGALTMLGPFGTDASLPALPTIADEFGSPAGQVQLTLTGFVTGMAAGQLLAGPLSDMAGRRRPLLWGTAGVAVAGGLAALAPSLVVLIAASACMGLGTAFALVVSRAVVADLASGPALTRSYALLGTVTGIGPVLGPVGGAALLVAFGWRGVFAGLATAAIVGVLLAARLLPESLPPERRVARAPVRLPGLVRRTFRSRSFVTGAVIVWLTFAALFAYISASPFLLQSLLGLSPGWYAAVFAANGCGLIVTGLTAARLSSRLSRRTLLAIGLGMQVTGALACLSLVLLDAVTLWTLLPPLFLIASSIGFIFGPAHAHALHDLRDMAGTALATIGAVQFLGAGLVAPLVQIRGEGDPLPFALAVTCCSLAALVTLVARSDAR
ncbi:multidrug effflux MFS transporter [Demequina pelophila]|uniref:multidrug effflux MFS transporter n=1 Tax=Demequina pelophila TaxID=1638984 RepID=UPI0012DFF539|nr:multidrug effflux MFS transporter [Demequina pelophila]